ncbi:hypothetical protein ACFQY4_37305 [Catellatospora bangladeshensis]|uniref:hypothetical protein n=1 Tax=Catellatospora bangladeshensis TaxID=310355 RepID=UPI00362047BA
MRADGTTLLVGWTDLGFHNQSFLDSAEQVAWDVAGGFPYTAATKAGEILQVTVDAEILMLGDMPLAEVELADTATAGADLVTERSDSDLVSWWKSQLGNAFRYRDHRRPAA